MHLNVSAIQEVLDLHRSGFDNLVPMHESLKQHFEQNRRSVLEGHQRFVDGLELFIYASEAESEHEKAQVMETERIIDEFAAWIKEWLDRLDSNKQ